MGNGSGTLGYELVPGSRVFCHALWHAEQLDVNGPTIPLTIDTVQIYVEGTVAHIDYFIQIRTAP
jgi:hypothetical protein